MALLRGSRHATPQKTLADRAAACNAGPMKNLTRPLLPLFCALTLAALPGCGAAPARMMKATTQVQPGPDTALVTFMRPNWGHMAWDPILRATNSGYLIFVEGDYVGELRPNTYIQYRTTPGRHDFIIMDQNLAGIEAHLVAGHSYFLNITEGLVPVHPVAEVLRPDDVRIDRWLGRLTPVELDPAEWQEKKAYCGFPTMRPIAPKLCAILEQELNAEIALVRDGDCRAIPTSVQILTSGAFRPFCKLSILSPEDGR